MANPTRIQVWFDSAVRRWPAIGWPWEAFERHARATQAQHLEDLYLAGAAGNRISAAWEAIERDLGAPVKNVLERVARADLSTEDMWGHALVKLMDDDPRVDERPGIRRPAQILRYRGLVPLLNYFITVARRLAIQRHRKRKEQTYQTSAEDESTPIMNSVSGAPEPAAVLIGRETDEQMRKSLAGAFASLSSQQRFLLAMVYGQGMKQKAAGKLLGWSEFKTSREMTKTIDRLRKSLDDLSGVDWTPELTSAWQGVWEKSWSQVQVRQTKASDPDTELAEPSHG